MGGFTYVVMQPLYVVITTMISPPGYFPIAYQTPKYWMALIAFISILAISFFPYLLRQVYISTYLAFAVMTALSVSQADIYPNTLLALILWLILNILVSFIILNPKQGIGINLIVFIVVIGSVVTKMPFSAIQSTDLATWFIVVVAFLLISYTLSAFIENNISIHTDDSKRLESARKDALTGIYGRGAIEEELDRSAAYAKKTKSALSIIVTDIDHFKVVNDENGHPTGDKVLQSFAKILQNNTSGRVGRWGGEEFVIILAGVSKPDAMVLAERLRQEVSREPIEDLPITASFGVASYRGASDTVEHLFGRADNAMYEAKRSGRNAVR